MTDNSQQSTQVPSNPCDVLLPCPFCGEDKKLYIKQPAPLRASMWSVYCDECGACGGADVTTGDAANCWNQRAAPAPNPQRGSPPFPEVEAAVGGGNSPDVRPAHSSPRDDWWRVEVSDHSGQVVAVERGLLAGREIGPKEERAIRGAIRDLSSFIGARGSDETDERFCGNPVHAVTTPPAKAPACTCGPESGGEHEPNCPFRLWFVNR